MDNGQMINVLQINVSTNRRNERMRMNLRPMSAEDDHQISEKQQKEKQNKAHNERRVQRLLRVKERNAVLFNYQETVNT